MKKILTRDEILQADDIKTEKVDVSKWWGGMVIVRGFMADEYEEFEQSVVPASGFDKPNLRNFRAKVTALCSIEENGKRMFSLEDVEKLAKKSAAPLRMITDVAFRLSGLTKESMEEMAKNLRPGQGEDSSSG